MTYPFNRFARGRAPSAGRTYETQKMNKTEADYADYLELLKIGGEIIKWQFEAVKLKLADSTFYTPDFIILTSDGFLEIHEVKGFWQDDARVKIKVAAKEFPYFQFIAIKKAKGNQWEREVF